MGLRREGPKCRNCFQMAAAASVCTRHARRPDGIRSKRLPVQIMNGESVFYCSGLPLRTKCGIIGAGLRRTPDSPGGSSSANAALQRKRRAARGGGLPDGVIGGKDGRNRAAAEGGSALPDGVCSGNDAAARGGQHRAQNRRAACAAHPNLGERYEGTFDDFLDLFQNWRIYVRRRIRHAAAAAKGRRGEARLGHG